VAADTAAIRPAYLPYQTVPRRSGGDAFRGSNEKRGELLVGRIRILEQVVAACRKCTKLRGAPCRIPTWFLFS
jgi:hypothetical protein